MGKMLRILRNAVCGTFNNNTNPSLTYKYGNRAEKFLSVCKEAAAVGLFRLLCCVYNGGLFLPIKGLIRHLLFIRSLFLGFVVLGYGIFGYRYFFA